MFAARFETADRRGIVAVPTDVLRNARAGDVLYGAAKGPVTEPVIRERLIELGFASHADSCGRILSGLERKGYLSSLTSARHSHRVYRVTERGRLAVRQVEQPIRQLCGSRYRPECCTFSSLAVSGGAV